jgi:cytochrome c-type biogenesis protein CcmF
VFALLMAPLVFVMGIGPITRWKEDKAGELWRRLRWALAGALAAALALEWIEGKGSLATTGGLMMSFWIIASLLVDLKQRLLPPGGTLGQMWHRARQIPLAMQGMMAAHFGIAVFAFGVAMVNSYSQEADVKMGPGTSTTLAGYTFSMQALKEVQGPNYAAMQGRVDITQGDKLVATVFPEKRIYRVQRNPMTESGVHSNLWRDLYISMGESLPTGEWIVRVQYKPFITWIWGGCLLMMLGGVLAMSDRRYRVRQGATARSTEGAAEGTA